MSINTSEKIRYALIKQKMNIGELADKTGQSRQNLSNKLTRGKFTTQELEAIAAAMGISFEAYFVLPDGTKI